MVGAYVAGGTVIGLVCICLGDLGRGQAANGVRFGAVFFGMALGMWLGPSVVAGFSRRRLFGLALIFAGASLALLALIPNLVLALTMSVILGSCAGLARVMGLRANLRVRFEFGQRSLTNLDSNATPLKMLPMPGR